MIQKDISRLETITERFSKIGSIPELKAHNIVAETNMAFEYLKRRSSKLVHFSFETDFEEILQRIDGFSAFYE